jgi:hypothetical protein
MKARHNQRQFNISATNYRLMLPVVDYRQALEAAFSVWSYKMKIFTQQVKLSV